MDLGDDMWVRMGNYGDLAKDIAVKNSADYANVCIKFESKTEESVCVASHLFEEGSDSMRHRIEKMASVRRYEDKEMLDLKEALGALSVEAQVVKEGQLLSFSSEKAKGHGIDVNTDSGYVIEVQANCHKTQAEAISEEYARRADASGRFTDTFFAGMLKNQDISLAVLFVLSDKGIESLIHVDSRNITPAKEAIDSIVNKSREIAAGLPKGKPSLSKGIFVGSEGARQAAELYAKGRESAIFKIKAIKGRECNCGIFFKSPDMPDDLEEMAFEVRDAHAAVPSFFRHEIAAIKEDLSLDHCEVFIREQGELRSLRSGERVSADYGTFCTKKEHRTDFWSQFEPTKTSNTLAGRYVDSMLKIPKVEAAALAIITDKGIDTCVAWPPAGCDGLQDAVRGLLQKMEGSDEQKV